ncbi:metal ABC transporter substrate-binding protein [Paenibacillus sp. JCM 10914]|uniref:metal ABC transporter solute-binding protein, Zn/Mn family n=1 Tax=Paenibacillus sp. JCM 10914 TaxID=1236974 RepID=UPI0003CC5B46|nr:zinc ABC transporter substrate-binding protein [Paenibacillus sp. JCM 10914]GAE04534.1 zinc ABC transporter, periplasmic-binding protein ZnuA [Paenibacillus sp. JCM 10914]
MLKSNSKRKRSLWTVSSAAVMAAVLILSGCGSKTGSLEEGKVNVITTFYPIYEFAKEIGGDEVNVLNLLPTGVEPHDWTPRSQDIVNTSKAQLFLYNGAGLEGWVPGFLKGLDKSTEVKPVEVSQGIALIDAEGDDGHGHGHSHGTTEDHQDDTEHAADDHADHDHEHDHDHDHEHDENQPEASESSHHTDPHTWVSPKSALIMAENIKKSFVEVDPEHKELYEQRFEGLKEKLVALDHNFTTELSKLPNHDIVVSHQAFGYLCRDYGLTQHSIMGLSPDAEPRAQDIVNLTKTVKEKNVRYIFFEELVSDKLARTLANEAGVETLVLNPVEGLTKEQVDAGENYFTLMEKNLQNLKKALQ